MSLAAVTVLKNMTSEALTRLELGSTILEPRDGATIFAQDDPADAVFAIIAGDGHVRVGSIDRNSKALMVEVFRAGEIFGEIGVIDGGSRTAAAVTEGKVRLMKIRAATFLTALATSAELGDALCRLMARRLRRTFELFQDATFSTLEVRLARQILYLISRGSRQTPQGIRLADRLRQADLADLLGATTRSIITTLNAWRAAGLVLYDTDRALLTVCDVARLRTIVDPDQETLARV
jgi:CRP/FNR family transcriptional regulator, cyclic AMP receptor protein